MTRAEKTVFVYRPAMDWITLTSYEQSFFDFWHQELRMMSDDYRLAKESNVQQYGGRVYHDSAGGSLFLGSGYQKGAMHHRMYISGCLAEKMRSQAMYAILELNARCTRVDIQITADHPGNDEWIWRLFNRARRNGIKVGWRESEDIKRGQTATVYLGSLASDRFVRVYEKVVDDEKMLRLEVQFQHRAAPSAGLALATGKLAMGDMILGSILRIGDVSLHRHYAGLLAGWNPGLPTVARQDTKTERWLINQVLPTFGRVISADSSDGKVLEAFVDVIDKVLVRG